MGASNRHRSLPVAVSQRRIDGRNDGAPSGEKTSARVLPSTENANGPPTARRRSSSFPLSTCRIESALLVHERHHCQSGENAAGAANFRGLLLSPGSQSSTLRT